jgi:RimJ/RimL family protein N-acetyltransferase
VLATERLDLREITHGDLDFFRAMTTDPEVMRHYPEEARRRTPEEWIERQLDRYARDGHGPWLAIERATGEPVGQIGLIRHEIPGSPVGDVFYEVGYMVHRPYWRRGFAREAAVASRDYGFGLGQAVVYSMIDPANTPSMAVARSIGMTPRAEILAYGDPHVLYGVAASELE